MRAVLLCLSWAVIGLAQTPVCGLFQDLESHDGETLTVRGEVVVSPRGAILGAEECLNRYRTRMMDWPVALELTPSPTAEDAGRARLAKLAPDRAVRVRGVFRGRLTMGSELNFIPARFEFDAVESLEVEALPPPARAMSMCELFRDLAVWKDKRISVRGVWRETMEGSWLSDRSCTETFVTNGFRWPVALSWGMPHHGQSSGIPGPAGLGFVTWTGRLRMREQYVAFCMDSGAYRTNGFGHLNYAVAELVVESVTDPQQVPDANRMPPADPTIGDERCNSYDKNYRCPAVTTLSQAALYGCIDQLKAILARAGIDSKESEPSPALDFAIRAGHGEIVRMLLKAGAPAQPRGSLSSPPGAIAVEAKQPGILRTLLDAGLDPNSRNSEGRTMLMQAGLMQAGAACTECVRVLLERGADPSLRNASGKTALDLAREVGNEAAATLIAQRTAVK